MGHPPPEGAEHDDGWATMRTTTVTEVNGEHRAIVIVERCSDTWTIVRVRNYDALGDGYRETAAVLGAEATALVAAALAEDPPQEPTERLRTQNEDGD